MTKLNELLKDARERKYGMPWVNCTNSVTVDAVFDAAKAKGAPACVEFSIGAGKFCGGTVTDSVGGAFSLATYARFKSKESGHPLFLHTDHCQEKDLDFVRGLLKKSVDFQEATGMPLFDSFMFDGGALPLEKNLEVAAGLLEQCAKAGIGLEIETAVVAGDEDGASSGDEYSCYTSPEDMLTVARKLFPILDQHDSAVLLYAAVFGNKHGYYDSNDAPIKTEILDEGQKAVREEFGKDFHLVCHGGSGLGAEVLGQAVEYGTVKMNLDTECQFAFTTPLVHYMRDDEKGGKVLQPDLGKPAKKMADPRNHLKLARESMAEAIGGYMDMLNCSGKL